MPPRKLTELNPAKVNKQLDDRVSTVIWERLEPVRKWFMVVALALVSFLGSKIWTGIGNLFVETHDLKTQMTNVIKQMDTLTDIPLRVHLLEDQSVQMRATQAQGQQNQIDILSRISQLDGFIKGLQSNKQPENKP